MGRDTSTSVYRPIREANWLIDIWCSAPPTLNLTVVTAVKSPRCILNVEKNSKVSSTYCSLGTSWSCLQSGAASVGAMVATAVVARLAGPDWWQHLPGAGYPQGRPVSWPGKMTTPYLQENC
ncbi:hypothetical protein L1987_43213 [Smallanthus sonchifolius]|uniref:Uncharacterized protein n=1 Tax=Smallanthus sonchifolius TaxID=185202 RepID=A0ACB9GM06_9ASTR|nr:hypothetical protein L1987_43213 [Smallanthus sonchifolius]